MAPIPDIAPPIVADRAWVFVRVLRPKQWTKNLLLFAGALFARQLFIRPQLGRVICAFLGFCLISSALYVFNDLVDLPGDRNHPRKRLRPIASGALSIRAAALVMSLAGLAGLVVAYSLGMTFLLTALVYVTLTIAYTLCLKRLVIVDIMVISIGFVLRAIAGAVAVGVSISPWLLLCTLLLALFLALTKRRQELNLNSAASSRGVLESYSIGYLDQAITVVTAATLMSYFLYTFTSAQSKYLMLTIPFVLYGVFRYLLLAHRQGMGEEPEEVLLRDFPFQLNLLLWLITSGLIIYLP